MTVGADRGTPGDSVAGTQLDMYRRRMEEIKRRLEIVRALAQGDRHLRYLPVAVETAHLQLRKVLELIAMSMLVVNEDEPAPKVRKLWRAGSVLKAAKKLNPDYYYPKPLELDESGTDNSQAGAASKARYRGRLVDVDESFYPLCQRR